MDVVDVVDKTARYAREVRECSAECLIPQQPSASVAVGE
jgi:hypothetical protein